MRTFSIPTRLRAGLALVLAALAAVSITAWAQPGEDFDEYMAQKAAPTWQESAYTLPPAPQADDLATYPVSANTRLSFAVDAKTLATSQDGVVRYTSVITSPQGARNVTFEGIRCETYEYRIYATAGSDGKWTPSRDTNWHLIRGYGANGYRGVLYRDFFCDNKMVRGSAKTIAQELRYPKPLNNTR